MPYDPTLYRGSAEYYVRGRPPYSRELGGTLARELGLDGSGRLLDVGCGPGVLALELADRFAELVGVDPDADMLAEATGSAARLGITKARWVHAVAEDLGALQLGKFRLVTFGQSFHWTDRERVAEMVYDLLEPGGALAVIVHVFEGRPRPTGPDLPPIPGLTELVSGLLGALETFDSPVDMSETARTFGVEPTALEDFVAGELAATRAAGTARS